MTVRGTACGSAFVAVLASCTPAPRPPTPTAIAEPAAPVCRVGPDDGPPMAERGIGGTGAPAIQLAERGIGGTGIIGVVTGFASICLAGREVALPTGVPIEIGGAPADPRALRAGQVAAIEASGDGTTLTARRIEVRYEVSGPIESVTADRVQVAGQTVLLGPDTWLRTPPALGQWVAVSGLRNATGAIVATRLDLVSTRTVLIHGIIQRTDGQYRLGTLPLQPPPGDLLVPGLPVSVTGVYGDAGLKAASVSRDLLVADPGAYFGTYTTNFIVEGYPQPISGQIPFGTQSFAPASSRPVAADRSIATFERTPAGGVRLDSVVTSSSGSPHLQPTSDGRFQQAPTPSRSGSDGRFAPAPVPNRAVGGRGALPDPTGRAGGADRGGGMRSPNGPPSNAAPGDMAGGRRR
ncbi:MAG: DUF5666 domain-containing protein [Janthinobacterium lividum]